MLVRLIYASRAAATPKNLNEQVRHIIDSAQARNADLGVTGVLCMHERNFVQVLEGDRAAVNRVYTSITRDQRHEEITLLSYGPIDERRFAHWSMVELDLSRVNPAVLLRFMPTPHFDPLAVGPEQLLTLIADLSASVAVVGRDTMAGAASNARRKAS